MMTYDEFVEKKRLYMRPSGFDISRDELNPYMKDFQRDITQWAIKTGRSAIFADCGLGKSLCELEWANQVRRNTGNPVIMFAPLGVSLQMVGEGNKFGIESKIVQSQSDVIDGINITNYEKMHRFDPGYFSGIILDESSILKGFLGKMRHQLTLFASHIPYRLCGTATPAPNDLLEIINHAEFLGIMTTQEIKALFFTQDGNSTQKFRLRRHAVEDFWKWVGSWAVALRMPSDLGYDDAEFVLPSLNIENIVVETNVRNRDTLFAMDAITLKEQQQSRRLTVVDRAEMAAKLVNSSKEQWLIWCDLNDESVAVSRLIPDSVEVKGSDSVEHKEDAMIGFALEKYRVMVTKPSIAGFGMNWQQCHNVIYLGLSHSYEKFYQSLRRLLRFGQKYDVNCYIITCDTDGAIVENIKRKDDQSKELYSKIIEYMMTEHELLGYKRIQKEDIYRKGMILPKWLKTIDQSEEIEEKLQIDDRFITHISDIIGVDPFGHDYFGELEEARLTSRTDMIVPDWLKELK